MPAAVSCYTCVDVVAIFTFLTNRTSFSSFLSTYFNHPVLVFLTKQEATQKLEKLENLQLDASVATDEMQYWSSRNTQLWLVALYTYTQNFLSWVCGGFFLFSSSILTTLHD